MKQYDDLNQGLKSLDQKFLLPEKEQSEVLADINRKLDISSKKSKSFEWKYYLATAGTILLIAIVVMSLITSDKGFVSDNDNKFIQGTSDEDPTYSAIDSEEVDFSFHVENKLSFDIYAMELRVYQNGELIGSPTGMHADGSKIKLGEVIDFDFLKDDGLTEGEINIELLVTVEEAPSGNEKRYRSLKTTVQIWDEYKDYSLLLIGESKEKINLINVSEANEKSLNVKRIEVQENKFAAMVQEKFKIGLSKEEVIALIENNNQNEIADFDKKELFWRYDFGENYTFPFDEVSQGDIKGLKSGAVQGQVYISWDEEGKISSYSVLYLNHDDRKVYDYRVMENGLEKHHAITE